MVISRLALLQGVVHKNSRMFEFPAFLPPTNLPMHSQSALTEHVSLNLAGFFLLDPVQRGAKIFSPCLKFPPHFCQAKWPAHAQPIGPDGTCVTQLSSINFARPCTNNEEVDNGTDMLFKCDIV